MYRSVQTPAIFLVTLLTFSCIVVRDTAGQDPYSPPASTAVNLRWGQRPGVSRYRLQLARDRGFADIVFDRVVEGQEIQINDLEPGRYFWRVAALTKQLGEFSSAGVIEVLPATSLAPTHTPTPKPAISEKAISAGGGWRAAVGSVTSILNAHLRATDRFDLVVANANGLVSALDATSGVALWSWRIPTPTGRPAIFLRSTTLAVPDRSRLDNVAVLAGSLVFQIEGRTGRELWRATLPAVISGGTVLNGRTDSNLIVVDNSRQRLFVLSGTNGNLSPEVKLPARIVGRPVAFADQGRAAFAVAYDTGDVEMRDVAGALIRAANVNSPVTTAPLFVRGRRGDLILVGTREGLSAMTLNLLPLGRVSIEGDAPYGRLWAQDLDGDGVPEIIMTTERRRLIAVDSTEGKILWNVSAGDYGASLAFADVNGDQFLDVFTQADQRFALALSGRDGSVIWREDSAAPASVTNHAATLETPGLATVPFGAGVLLITGEPSRTGLRAIAFSKR